MAALLQFLSTLSLRRATCRVPASPCPLQYFYPRSPCGERQEDMIFEEQTEQISIHALLAESDFIFFLPLVLILLFLSTLSLRRATVTVLGIQHKVGISIHALLAESDLHKDHVAFYLCHFYPRSPCGERLKCNSARCHILLFLSTLSLRRATVYHRYET